MAEKKEKENSEYNRVVITTLKTKRLFCKKKVRIGKRLGWERGRFNNTLISQPQIKFAHNKIISMFKLFQKVVLLQKSLN